MTDTNTDDTEQEIRDRLLVKEIKCKHCGQQPKAGWKNGHIHLVCDCGSRELPDDIVPDHKWMPDGVEWTVVEDA